MIKNVLVLSIAVAAFATGANAQTTSAAAQTATAPPQKSVARVEAYPRAADLQQNAPTAAAPAPAAAAAQAQAPLLERLETLGMGDQVRITVFRNPDLTTETRVNERGTILFPMVGEISITGLTPSQAGARIADKLRAGKFVVNPEVNVSIAQVNSRQVSVLGNVNKPGRYPLDSVNSRLTDVLATAGGVAGAGADLVTIVSSGNRKTDIDIASIFRNGDLSKNVELQPGDTVYVHRAPMVYVYGEVQKGGAYRVEPHMTVMQAIALASGITPRGTERGVKISRRAENGAVRKFDAKLTDPVEPDDVIYVRESLF